MLHKTVDDTDIQSVSTKLPMPKAASFFSPSKRQMYRSKASENNQKVQMEICNMIAMQPQQTTYISSDHVIFFENSGNLVVLTDCHYKIMNDRSKPLMICRNCEPFSQNLFWNARKPGATMYLQSVQLFSNKDYQSMMHFNITKYNSSNMAVNDSRDIYIELPPQIKPIHFMTIQNSKKGIIISQCVENKEKNSNQYHVLLINLIKSNKIKNSKFVGTKKENKFSFFEEEKVQEQKQPKNNEKQYIFQPMSQVKQKISFNSGQKIIKMINSQYGDSVLIITNCDIYEIDFEDKEIVMKKLHFQTKFAKYTGKQDNSKDEIKDISYIIDGLKLIFITVNGYLGIFEAENIQYAQNIYDIGLDPSKFHMKTLHQLIGKVGIQTQQGSVLLYKLDSHQISLIKNIQLPTQDIQLKSYKVNMLEKQDQLIIQRIVRGTKTKLEVLSKNLLSPSSQFNKIYSANLLDQKIKTTNAPIKITNSKCNRIVCVQRENTLTFYKLNQNFSSQSPPIQELFSKTFFEKPNYVSFDPYGSNVIILFRQFVKFFKFQYRQLSHYYTYNVRNVCYAGFTELGQYITISVDDMLYFINPFTFETQRTMEAYGDIKSVRFYDNILYVLLKTKVSKLSSETLFLHMYTWNDNEYKMVREIKVEPTEALLTSSTFVILASAKELFVYKPREQIFNDERRLLRKDSDIGAIDLIITKKLKFSSTIQFPTCIALLQSLGVLLIGTSAGRVYEYLWPLNQQQDLEILYSIHCSTSQIAKIQLSTSFNKIHVYCRNLNILEMGVVQYIDGEEMPNIYVINTKSLYGNEQLKYQFANRDLLYANYTPYIYEEIRKADETAQELKFILEKNIDDIEEFIAKANENYQKEIESINLQKQTDANIIYQEKNETQDKFMDQIKTINEAIALAQKQHKQKIEKEQESYEKKLLQIYKEAARLKGIYENLENEQSKEKYTHILENDRVLKKFQQENEKVEAEYKLKFEAIQKNNQLFQMIQKQQGQKHVEEELKQYKRAIRQAVEQELKNEQFRKETLLGSNGSLLKQIANYKQRRDEFQALVMETHLQIDELNADQNQYANKRKYLVQELLKKQRIIEQKERQMIRLIEGTSMMKKLKETHQYELKEYQQEFEPIIKKMSTIEQDVQKMNGEILKEYIGKTQREKQIISSTQKIAKLKKTIANRIKSNQISQTKLMRFLAQLDLLLEKPFDKDMKKNLISLSLGENYIVNEQEILNKIQNIKLLRRKQFIRKQIQEEEKREQMVIRNKNEITKHYNQNAVLVREFNYLKLLQKDLLAQKHEVELKLMAAKANQGGRVPKIQTPAKKTRSVIQLKKISERKLTPFQKHEQQFNQMFNKGLTSETKLTRSGGQSMSLLKSLIKDVDTIDSRYEKMEIVRERIRSFVNPEVRIRKNIITQRANFDRKKVESQTLL